MNNFGFEDLDLIFKAKTDFEDLTSGRKNINKNLLKKWKKFIPKEHEAKINQYINRIPSEGIDVKKYYDQVLENMPEDMREDIKDRNIPN